LDLFSRIRPLISLLIVIVYIELRVLKSAFQTSVTSLEQNGLLLRERELFRYAQVQGRLIIPNRLGLCSLA